MSKVLSFEFTVDADYDEWINCSCSKYGYKKDILDPNASPLLNKTIPNPETEEEFSRRQLIQNYLKGVVISMKAPQKGQQAETAEKEKIDKWVIK